MTTKNLTLTLLSLMIASTFPSRARAAVTTLSMPGATDVSFGYDDTLYATAGASILRYSTQTKSFLPSWTLGGSLLGIDLSPDGKTLAVADNSNANGLDGVDLVNTTTGQSQRITFPLQSLENGTFMVAWGANNQLLITSTFNGSGEVPLRDYNPSTNSVTTLTNVQQDTMLTPSADRQTIALAQSNDSGGPVGFYNVQSASLNPGTNTNWFVFEIAVNNNGTQFAVPSYDGTFVYDRNWNLLTTLGTYASSSPIAAVYSPDDSVLYTAWYDYNTANAGVKAYSTSTWKLLQTFDTYNFPWTGNFALDAGRMDVSPDGNFLAVTVSGGVQLINLPEPTTIAPITAAAVLLRRRRRPTTLHPPAIQS